MLVVQWLMPLVVGTTARSMFMGRDSCVSGKNHAVSISEMMGIDELNDLEPPSRTGCVDGRLQRE